MTGALMKREDTRGDRVMRRQRRGDESAVREHQGLLAAMSGEGGEGPSPGASRASKALPTPGL